ncbi:MAG: redoxin domain-containing protein [Clostridia bacterium]|nr:redoxin domain-containing protein [Clostridia bacterium]
MARITAGEKLPDFKVDTSKKRGTSFSEIAGGKPTMFVVLRYIGCPSCRYDVHCLAEKYSEFEAKGVNVAVVMQSSIENLEKALADANIPFPIVADTDMQVYKTLAIDPAKDMPGLVGGDMEKLQAKGAKCQALGFEHGEYEGIEEQLPAFFYVEGDLTVKVAHYGTTIMDMPTAEDMLAMI